MGFGYGAVGRVFQAQEISGLKAEKHKLGRGRLQDGMERIVGRLKNPEIVALEFSLWNLGSAASGLMSVLTVHKAE